jgi:elongation factor 2
MNEPLRGIRVNILDAQLHADAVHRNVQQVGSATRHAVLGAILSANPSPVEPFYKFQIQIPSTMKGIIYSKLATRRGQVTGEEMVGSTPLSMLTGHLPVYESFGLDQTLKEETSGQAFLQLLVSHWQRQDSGTPLALRMIQEARIRRKLKADVPSPSEYLDKM